MSVTTTPGARTPGNPYHPMTPGARNPGNPYHPMTPGARNPGSPYLPTTPGARNPGNPYHPTTPGARNPGNPNHPMTPGARNPGNLFSPNGRPHMLPPPPPQGRPCTLLPTPSPMNGTDDHFSNEDQVQRLSDIYKEKNIKIGVLYPTGGYRGKADAIAGHLTHLLSGGSSIIKVYEMRKDGQFWLTIAVNEGVSKYVFVGVPPVRARGPLFSRQHSSIQEDDFFNPHERRGKRVTEVVFIDTPLPTPQPPSNPQARKASLPKSYEGFLHLNCDMDDAVLADSVLGHFAGENICVRIIHCVLRVEIY